MQKRKPTRKKDLNPEAVEQFVGGADHAPAPEAKKEVPPPVYPWEAPHVREDMTKVFNLRLSEPLYLKLKWLSENTPQTSMQKICVESVETVVNEEVQALRTKLEKA